MATITATNDIDRAFLEGIRAGDNRKIRQVYDLALPSVIRWVEENNGSESDARDIFQEALIALFRKLEPGEFTLTCTLKSFLRIMCRNLWLTRLRNRKNKTATPLENVDEVSLDKSILENIEDSERNRLFFKHFDLLGEKCRQILSLFFDKMPLSHIAKKMDTSENYIKKRKFICKEKLVKGIQQDPVFSELKNG